MIHRECDFLQHAHGGAVEQQFVSVEPCSINGVDNTNPSSDRSYHMTVLEVIWASEILLLNADAPTVPHATIAAN